MFVKIDPQYVLIVMAAVIVAGLIGISTFRKSCRFLGIGKDADRLSEKQCKTFAFRQSWALITLGSLIVCGCVMTLGSFDIPRQMEVTIAMFATFGGCVVLAGVIRFLMNVE